MAASKPSRLRNGRLTSQGRQYGALMRNVLVGRRAARLCPGILLTMAAIPTGFTLPNTTHRLTALGTTELLQRRAAADREMLVTSRPPAGKFFPKMLLGARPDWDRSFRLARPSAVDDGAEPSDSSGDSVLGDAACHTRWPGRPDQHASVANAALPVGKPRCNSEPVDEKVEKASRNPSTNRNATAVSGHDRFLAVMTLEISTCWEQAGRGPREVLLPTVKTRGGAVHSAPSRSQNRHYPYHIRRLSASHQGTIHCHAPLAALVPITPPKWFPFRRHRHLGLVHYPLLSATHQLSLRVASGRSAPPSRRTVAERRTACPSSDGTTRSQDGPCF